MQNRKILTLEEILNLDRRPTLQEMVDLSVEDYTKYLYYKRIIKYMPESGNAKDYEPDYDDWNDYYPDNDVVLELNDPNLDEGILDNRASQCFWDFNTPEENLLNESLGIIDEEYSESLIGKNGKKYSYCCKVLNDGERFYYVGPLE